MAIRLFGVLEAKHFCSSFSGLSGRSQESIEDFQENVFGNVKTVFSEGSLQFNEYRDILVRDVERCLFLSASHYRRVLDMMIPSASHWAYVTLYYGSWYAAHGILGMFGCRAFYKTIIDVQVGTPGKQKLRQRKFGKKTGQYKTIQRGSHKKFWEIFYDAAPSLIPLVPQNLAVALKPIQQNPYWQIENRNNINYDTYNSFDLAESFNHSFADANFPSSLPGILGTQYGILERLLEISFFFIDRLQLSSDSLTNLGANLNLRSAVNDLIYLQKPPGLVRKTKKQLLI